MSLLFSSIRSVKYKYNINRENVMTWVALQGIPYLQHGFIDGMRQNDSPVRTVYGHLPIC